MTGTSDIPTLERITFFRGQPLLAADLTALQQANRELRWLHNRALHAWGIGIGFAATGERGDTIVTIGSGYGIDNLGREIILTDSQAKSVPAVSGAPNGGEASYYLVASYEPDADQKVLERRAGICLPGDTIRLSEDPRIDWRRTDQLTEGLELVLAQAWIQNCQLSRPLSLAPRRYARPPQQPYVAAGQTDPKDTPWALWPTGGAPIGVTTDVDTSSANFRTTPRYEAHVVGNRVWTDGSGPNPVLLIAFAGIVAAAPASFTLQVAMPELAGGLIPVNTTPGTGQDLATRVHSLSWYVVWMGTEG
jgi:hypothetical protein